MWLVHKRHDSFTYATWRTHMRNTTYYLFTSGVKMIGLFCKRDLSKRRYSAKETYNFKGLTNHSHPIATWPITYLSAGNDRYIFDMTHSYVPWLIHQWKMTDLSLMWLVYLYKKNVWHSYEYYIHMPWPVHRWDMGWLRSVGSIKLQVSFAEYCLFYRALLQ